MSGTTGPENDAKIRRALVDYAARPTQKAESALYAAIADWHRREMEQVGLEWAAREMEDDEGLNDG